MPTVILRNVVGRRVSNLVVVGFSTTCKSVSITTNAVSSNPVRGQDYSIQHRYKLPFDYIDYKRLLENKRFPNHRWYSDATWGGGG